MDDIDEAPLGASGQDHHLVLMTFVGRRKGVRNVKKSLKNTFKQAEEIMPSSGEMFNICENFDTYQKGGLYPLLHVCRNPKVVEKIQESEEYLDEDALGEGLVVDQALFEEASCIDIPGSDADDFVLTVAAFKSIEPTPNAKLLKHWKSWTGARAYFEAMMTAGIDCQKMSFLVRNSPLMEDEQDFPGFYYLLVCQVGIREPSDEGLIVDVLQRFRVERWFGYQTIYRHYRH